MIPSIISTVTKYDKRGNLSIIEAEKDIPFEIKRVYYIWDNKDNLPRGGHAHKELWEAMIALHGACKIKIDDGKSKVDYILSKPDKVLIFPPGYWRDLVAFADDCVLLVLASEYYDESDYIRDYEEYLKYIKDRDENSLL
ncbi:MAG: FdtA/QdtA family cupin domain-containing protein [Mesotoga sp.]|nr:FdtA/QdtA family cupin domain-containing protein [Mesotoga sp.]